MVYIQERLVKVRQVQVVLCFVVLSESLVLWRRKLAEWCQVCVHISDIEAMRLVEVAIPGKQQRGDYHVVWLSVYFIQLTRSHKIDPVQTRAAPLPWNDDSILVVLQLKGEGVLLCVLSSRNASAGLRLLNVFHKLKIHI